MEAAREAQSRTDRLHVIQRGGSAITEFAAGSYVTLEYLEPSVPRAPTKLVARRAGVRQQSLQYQFTTRLTALYSLLGVVATTTTRAVTTTGHHHWSPVYIHHYSNISF